MEKDEMQEHIDNAQYCQFTGLSAYIRFLLRYAKGNLDELKNIPYIDKKNMSDPAYYDEKLWEEYR
jgi:hypothetical protein